MKFNLNRNLLSHLIRMLSNNQSPRLSKFRANRHSNGFSLVEVAVVLVVIGLSIGGVLRSREMITSANVANLIAQQSGIKAAYYGFIDRYSAEPGDLTAVQAALINANATPAFDNAGNGVVSVWDSTTFFNNLAQARFITCGLCMPRAQWQSLPNTTNTMVNVFASPLFVEGDFGATPLGGAANTADYLSPLGVNEPARLKLGAGGNTLSSLLAEMDRKLDDGNPSTGIFRASSLTYSWTGVGQQNTWRNMWQCVDLTTNNRWIVAPPQSCQGVLLF
jgi:prepilin-type N-terminal cleavage/methylation domain-containing protein